jgi:hypothetical protein
VELFSLSIGVESEEWLSMLPAVETTDSANTWNLCHIQKGGATSIPKDCSLHVGRLNLASDNLDLTVCSNERRGDVQRAVVVFGKTEADSDIILLGSIADELHLRRVDLERVVNILSDTIEVHGVLPIIPFASIRLDDTGLCVIITR